MNRQSRVLFTHGLALVMGVCLLTAVALSQDSRPKLSPTASMAGQTVTLLPDGTKLLAGGLGPYGPTDTAAINDRGNVTPLTGGLVTARAWHTATVASDGSVTIIGGIGIDGTPVGAAERFDPDTGTFSLLNANGLTPRSHHSATLLTDGTILIVGGISEDGATLGGAQVWNPRTNAVTATSSTLHIPRSGHTATLQANGDVLIKGGVDAAGNQVRSNEVYDPTTQSFTLAKSSKALKASDSAPVVAGSIPSAGAQNVPVNTTVSIRFSQPIDVTTVDSDTITLSASNENIAAHVVAAESGRLAFINPDSPLAPGTAYTVTVDGVAGTNGIPVPLTSFSFTTSSTTVVGSPSPSTPTAGSGGTDNWLTDPEAWIPGPNGDWYTHRPPSPWQSLPPYRAKAGVTALSGQVLTLDGMPLAGVTLKVGSQGTKTDRSGRFLLPNLQSGYVVLLIDGTSANNHGRTYGIFQTGVNLAPLRTTVLSFTIWMPLLDTFHAVTIPSPTSSAMVITNPLIPGLELHIPAGTTITDINGKVVTTVSITPVPLDRPPFPLPAGVQVPIYFTVQPGGAQLWSAPGKWALAQLYYPNPGHLGAGIQFDFWNYDATKSGWYVYGKGTVNQAGTEVVPNPGVGIWTFSGAMVGSPSEPPTTGGCQCDAGSNPSGGGESSDGGDLGSESALSGGSSPIDSSTGILRHSETDLHVADIIPIDFTRTYLSQDPTSRPFGNGFTDSYEIYITNNGAPNYTTLDIVLPDGEKVHYLNNGNQSDWWLTNYVATLTSNPSYYGSTVTWNNSTNNGWLLTLKNGTTYSFPEEGNSPAASALTGITDRYGNTLTINRDSNGNVTQITSPNGRWIQFASDSNNRITQATDDLGRTVTYGYDTCGSGYLCSVTDANGGTTSYSYYTPSSPPPTGYGGIGNMSNVVDPRGNTEVAVLYDTNGRGAQQTLADGTSTFPFSYTLTGNVVQQASITDPNGNVEQKSFDANGFVTTDSFAVGQSYEQTTTYTRDPNTELITAMTDPLERQTTYTYDSSGNTLTVTSLANTSQPVTTTYTYTPIFNELASLTDPLSHVWTFNYDGLGNLTSIIDPLTHQTTLSYNSKGQLASIADALNDTTQLEYGYNGDLSQVTDPLGNATKFSTDNAGRVILISDPLGNTTGMTYDNRDRIKQILDARNGTTSFSYDGNGNRLSVTDANRNQTSYSYDARNRLISRTDALHATDSYGYDGNGNLTQYTDRRGKVTVYQYDALNRRRFAGFGQNGANYESTIGYTWDLGNRTTELIDSIAGTTMRQYDGLDDLIEEQTAEGEVGYLYDSARRRTSMTVAGQPTVSYAWDNANRLTGITQGSTSIPYNYDNADRRTSLTLPNGIVLAYAHDADSRVTGLTWTLAGNPVGALGYSYDADGHVIAKTGSLAQTNLPQPATGNTFNADNEMTAFNGTAQSYDANGNLTSDGTIIYSWDARNHLLSLSGANAATFVYDPAGRRAQKTINGVSTQLLYDGLNPVQELQNGTPSANMLTGLGIDEYFQRTDSSGTSSYLTDALGSTLALANASGGLATSYTYDPFGNTAATGQASSNPYQFAGHENDNTGLYSNRARSYSPSQGRFISQDPIGFKGGMNLYEYTANQPTDLVDPTGNELRYTYEECNSLQTFLCRSACLLSKSQMLDCTSIVWHIESGPVIFVSMDCTCDKPTMPKMCPSTPPPPPAFPIPVP